jgi:hypothetical protein
MRAIMFGLVVVFFAIARTPGKPVEPAGLKVRPQADHVVLQWNGDVEPPMLARFEQAFRQLKGDPRRILISLNSDGGSVKHGHEVITEIRRASRSHSIDTIVEAGKSCASMCVPIYMSGIERFAHPSAQFMFHEASIRLPPETQRGLRALNVNVSDVKRTWAQKATDDLFNDDFLPQGVNAHWLEDMRVKIRNRDVWLTGQQLVAQRSGVVDKLR